MTNTSRFDTASNTIRSTAAALALGVTLALMGGLNGVADQQFNSVIADQADQGPTQVVVITGQRPARA